MQLYFADAQDFPVLGKAQALLAGQSLIQDNIQGINREMP